MVRPYDFTNPDYRLKSLSTDIITSQITLYPNPSNGEFFIQSENDNLWIYNNLGQVVHQQKLIKGTNNIQVNLPTGYYILKTQNQIIKLVIR
jgi:hypothetical protein